MNTLLIAYSYHNGNTAKVAEVFSMVLGARVKDPRQVELEELDAYDLIGLGSGIDSGRNYQGLLDFAEKLPSLKGKKAFIFSTNGVPGSRVMRSIRGKVPEPNHAALRDILEGRGFNVIGEFSCAGHNTNSFLKFFGGFNKGRPNAEDLAQAKRFALDLTK